MAHFSLIVLDPNGSLVGEVGEVVGAFQPSAQTLLVRAHQTIKDQGEITDAVAQIIYDLPKLAASLAKNELSLRVVPLYEELPKRNAAFEATFNAILASARLIQ